MSDECKSCVKRCGDGCSPEYNSKDQCVNHQAHDRWKAHYIANANRLMEENEKLTKENAELKSRLRDCGQEV